MKRIRYYLTGVLMGVVLTCQACDSTGDRRTADERGRQQTLQRVEIASAKNVWNTLPILAERLGYFREEGIDARLQYLAAGRYDLDALLAGTAQAALIVDVNIAYLGFTSDTSVVVLRTIARSSETAVVARRSAGISSPSDLAGKRLAYSPATTSELFANRLLQEHGIDSVKLMPVQPQGMFAAVTGRAVDAASTWEPFVHNIATALGSDAVVFRDSSAYVGYMNLAMKKQWVRENPETVRALIRSLERASEFARTNPQRAKVLVAETINLDSATVSAIWPLFDLTIRDATQELLQQVRQEGSWIRTTQRDFVGKPQPNYERFFNTAQAP